MFPLPFSKMISTYQRHRLKGPGKMTRTSGESVLVLGHLVDEGDSRLHLNLTGKDRRLGPSALHGHH
jgi:hypothetical protein